MHLTFKKCKSSLLMKISFLAILFTFAATCAVYSSAAQNLREIPAVLSPGSLTLRDALRELQSQTGIRFSYINREINHQRAAHVSAESDNLEAILIEVLEGTGLTYEQVGETVVIKRIAAPRMLAPLRKGANVTQDQEIQGLITDERGQPIPGVSIRVRGTAVGTVTNEYGEFRFRHDLQRPAVLVISHLGYQTLEHTYTPGTTSVLRFRLQPDFGGLDEVTVIAYGTTSRRVSTSSTAGISSEVIEQMPINNPIEALQGRIAGLDVSNSNGLPGAGFTVRLRGLNSLREGGNAPLYIIDGVPYFSESLNLFSGDNVGQSPLASINPADIERIDVLKDADATAIYGSRGANGVILISTKKGKAGKQQVNFNVYTGAGQVSNQVDMLSTAEYLQLRREAYANSKETPDSSVPDLNEWGSTRDQNWQDLLMGHTAAVTEANFSVSGGSDQTSLLLSGTYRHETTVQPGDNGYQKGAGMLTVNHQSEDQKFLVTATANYAADFNNAMATDISQYYNLAPNMPIYDDNGRYYWYGNVQNPFAFLERKHETRSKALLTSGTIRYNILKGLSLMATMGYNHTAFDQLQMYPLSSFNPATSATNMSYFGHNTLSSYSVEPQITYTVPLGGGTLDLLAGATWQQQIRDGQALQAEDFSSDAQLNNIDAAVSLRTRNFNYAKYRYQAGFARATYNYANKYIANATFRRDGSSRFGPDRRVGNFGSIGAAWVFSEESWFADQRSFINFGKLRGSFGVTGNDQIGNYGYLDSWSYASYPYDGVAGLYPTRVANPEYSWERNRKLEAGLELGFWENRLTVNINHYFNRSDNQLITSTLSPQTGFSGYTANLPGIVENRGWEFEVGSMNWRTDRFEWRTAANITIARNELVAYPDLEGSGEEGRFAIGHPLDIAFGFKFTGVDPQTGLAQFADLDGDDEVTNQLGDQYVMGTYLPNFFGGISNSFRYRNFDLSFLFQFVKQEGEALNFGYMASTALGLMANFDRSVERRWRQPGDQTDIPRAAAVSADPAYASYNTYYRHSDALWVDASFVRLKSLMLSYDLSELLERWSTRRVSVYAQGQNLWTITGYDGLDPETQGRVMPPIKYYTMGLRLTF